MAENDKLYLAAPLVKVTNLNNNVCDLNVLMDTSSPVSFIFLTHFDKYFGSPVESLETVDRKFNALTKTPINVLGKINSTIGFRDFPDRIFDIQLHAVNLDLPDIDLIVGRDFLQNNDLTLIFRPANA